MKRERGRLLVADIVALVAALGLLLTMALDWYSTNQGDEARRVESSADPGAAGVQGGEAVREIRERAGEEAEQAEDNAWQADAFVDRLILIALIVAIGAAVFAALARTSGRRYEPPWTPSLVAAGAAALAAVLVAYRIIQPPGVDDFASLKSGPPLALLCLAGLALGALWAWRAEESGRAWPKAEADKPAAEQADGVERARP